MERRDFLKSLLATTAGCALPSLLHSAETSSTPLLSNVFLEGGPDFRQLFVPAQSTTYGASFWNHRYPTWNLSGVSAVSALSETMHWTSQGNQIFGFHPQADWLYQQWLTGRVAIINNVVGSTSRNHEHCSIVMESGNASALPNDRQISGWGGRLAKHKGENIVSLTSRVKQFCYGPHDSESSSHDNRDVISVRNMSQFGLYRPTNLDDNPASRGYRETMHRSLNSYYQAKAQSVDNSSAYRPLMDHYEKLSVQGELIRQRLLGFEQDTQLKDLVSGKSTCYNRNFAQQCSNLFDSTLCLDILKSSIFSMAYGGFDSHKNQHQSLGEKFYDLFNSKGCLAQSMKALESQSPDIANNTVWMISGEFGRQLSANGDRGTDHGRGNAVILIGKPIKGGLYGELFPEEELSQFDLNGKDITGKTNIEPVIAKLCNWIAPNSATSIVPLAASRAVETGNALDFI